MDIKGACLPHLIWKQDRHQLELKTLTRVLQLSDPGQVLLANRTYLC